MAKKDAPAKAEEPVREPVYTLPPYVVRSVSLADGQRIDWGLTLTGVPNLWKITRGKGVRIAVLDTGFSQVHPDLAPAVEEAKDFTGSPTGIMDVQGHGTHTAGTIGARDDAGGIVGIANECTLLIGKVLGDDGSGAGSWIAAGIRWAIAKKVDIISMSLGSPVPDPVIKSAIDEAVAAGIIVVCAAGNEGPGDNTTGYPASWPNVISVGAIDQDRKIARFSSRGKVDIAAPGVNILSDWPLRSVAVLSGTSMATPFVAGVIGLIIAKHRAFPSGTPALTTQQIIEHLTKTAVDLGDFGKDNEYGWGLVDPAKFLDSDQPPVVTTPPAPGGVDLNAADFSPTGLQKLLAANIRKITISV